MANWNMFQNVLYKIVGLQLKKAASNSFLSLVLVNTSNIYIYLFIIIYILYKKEIYKEKIILISMLFLVLVYRQFFL